MLKRVIRTCLPILMLVYELEFRSSSASYIVIDTIVIFDPLPHDSAPPSDVVLRSFALSSRSLGQPTLVYCRIYSGR